MIREICICETPMRVEISVCVRSSAKRSRRTSRSRTESTPIASSSSTRISARSSSGSRPPIESASVTSSPVGSSSERVRRASCALDRRQHLLERRSTASASSCTVGERPSSVVSLSRALAISICSSCIPRGTRIAQVLVAEVALDLAEHGRRRVGREAHLAREVEALDGLHDPDAGDLHEVVERLAAAGVAAGERACEGQHLLGELVAGALVARLVVAAQELLLASRDATPAPADAARRASAIRASDYASRGAARVAAAVPVA